MTRRSKDPDQKKIHDFKMRLSPQDRVNIEKLAKLMKRSMADALCLMAEVTVQAIESGDFNPAQPLSTARLNRTTRISTEEK